MYILVVLIEGGWGYQNLKAASPKTADPSRDVLPSARKVVSLFEAFPDHRCTYTSMAGLQEGQQMSIFRTLNQHAKGTADAHWEDRKGSMSLGLAMLRTVYEDFASEVCRRCC